MSFLFFYKIREQEGRTGPPWGDWYQWKGEEFGEKVWEGEYNANSVYTSM
jgi:hypothetical protein